MLTLSDNTLYYFFSSSAQAVGAIAGLLGALLVFRYQGFLAEIDSRAEAIARSFLSGGSIGPAFFSKADRETYRDYVSHRQRIDRLREVFGKFWKTNDSSELEATFRANVENKPADLDAIIARKVNELRGWRFEIEHLDRQILEASGARRLAVAVTVMGLVIVALGLGGVLVREVVPETSHDRVCLAFTYGGLVLVYLGVVGVSVRAAFRKPF